MAGSSVFPSSLRQLLWQDSRLRYSYIEKPEDTIDIITKKWWLYCSLLWILSKSFNKTFVIFVQTKMRAILIRTYIIYSEMPMAKIRENGYRDWVFKKIPVSHADGRRVRRGSFRLGSPLHNHNPDVDVPWYITLTIVSRLWRLSEADVCNHGYLKY